MNEIVIVGIPNCGKTTAYNKIANKQERTGNWHGVTVDAVSSDFYVKKEKFILTDLPGIYSLTPYSNEEIETVNKLNKKDYGYILLIIDAFNLKQGLGLLKEVLTLNKPIIIAVNKIKLYRKRGGDVSLVDLAKLLGITVLDAEDKKLKEKIIYSFKNHNENEVEIISDFKENDICGKVLKSMVKSTISEKLFSSVAGSLLCFTFISVLSLYLSFGKYGLGSLTAEAIRRFLINPINVLFEKLCLKIGLSQFLRGLINSVVFGSCSVVLTFVPQVAVMSAINVYLDQSGIMPRLAYSLNFIFKKIGLTGKAVFALTCGFGCSAVAYSQCNGLDCKSLKKKCSFCVGFIPCGAKLPVISYLYSFVSNRLGFLFVVILYLLCILFMGVCSFFVDKIFKTENSPLLLQIPELNFACFRTTLKPLINLIKQFIIKISTTVFIVCTVEYLLGCLTLEFKLSNNYFSEDTLLNNIVGIISPIFYPLGVQDKAFALGAVSGLFSKESIVGTLSMIYPNGLPYSKAQIIAYAVFCVLYTPCIVALGTLKRVCGLKITLFFASFQFCFALLCCYLTYGVITLNWLLVLYSFLLVVIIFFALKFFNKKVFKWKFSSLKKQKSFRSFY